MEINNQRELFELKLKNAIEQGTNYSIISGKIITFNNAGAYCFAHGFPKGTYPELKLNINNIFLVSSIEEHNKFDTYFRKYKAKFGLLFVYNQIKKGIDLTDSIQDFIINN